MLPPSPERAGPCRGSAPTRGGLCALALAAPLFLDGCTAKPPPARSAVRLATTTSTENSGLLDVLLPPFTEGHGVAVHVIAVGTGRAIRHGKAGDVDVILVHAREAEEKFVEKGFGVNRRGVMHNDFVILGPEDDPAGIQSGRDAVAAFLKIAAAASPFVSRGDDSGTHVREMEIWRDAGVEPAGEWYLSAGQGMGAVLIMANEKRAYTLSDRATCLAFEDRVDLEVLTEGDPRLFNPYGIIAVNPARHPHVNYVGAMMLIAWVTSPRGQRIIADYTRGGEQLFYPDAVGRQGP